MRKILVAVALAVAGIAWADPAPITIDAKEMSFDRANHLTIGRGDVVVRYGDTTLRADEVRLNTQTKEAQATGGVRVNQGRQEWVAPGATYNFETRAFKADVVRAFADPLYLRGENVAQVTSNHYTVANVLASTCDYDDPHYRVHATRAEVYLDDRVVMYNCTIRLGDVPVFWVPVITWSLRDQAPPFIINLGANSRWGFYVLTTTNWRLDEHWRLAVDLDGRVDRGIAPGATASYAFGTNTTGAVRGYYLHDGLPGRSTNFLANLYPGSPLDAERYRVEWQHKQFFADDLALTVDLTKQSDAFVIGDFFNHEFRADREPDSVADLTKRGPNYTVSVLVRPQFNTYFAEVERLPEAHWSVNRIRLGETPIYYEADTSAGYYQNLRGKTGDLLFTGNAGRFDTFHQFVVPHTFFRWLNVVPRAGGRFTGYTDSPGTTSLGRFVGNLGTHVSFKLTRTWTEIRHIVEPFADYSWVPTPTIQSNRLFQFDTVRSLTIPGSETIPITRYLPLDLPADAVSRENILRLGLRQKLQTRRDNLPWDLVTLTGWTDYRAEKNAGEADFSNIHAAVETRPTSWLEVDAYSRYDAQAGVLRELNTEARVSRGDQWALGIGSRYLRGDSNLIAVDASYRLSRRWVVQTYQRVDMQDGRWEEQHYALRQELHDWYVDYGFRYRNLRTGEDDKAVYVAVTLKAYPGFRIAVN